MSINNIVHDSQDPFSLLNESLKDTAKDIIKTEEEVQKSIADGDQHPEVTAISNCISKKTLQALDAPISSLGGPELNIVANMIDRVPNLKSFTPEQKEDFSSFLQEWVDPEFPREDFEDRDLLSEVVLNHFFGPRKRIDKESLWKASSVADATLHGASDVVNKPLETGAKIIGKVSELVFFSPRPKQISTSTSTQSGDPEHIGQGFAVSDVMQETDSRHFFGSRTGNQFNVNQASSFKNILESSDSMNGESIVEDFLDEVKRGDLQGSLAKGINKVLLKGVEATEQFLTIKPEHIGQGFAVSDVMQETDSRHFFGSKTDNPFNVNQASSFKNILESSDSMNGESIVEDFLDEVKRGDLQGSLAKGINKVLLKGIEATDEAKQFFTLKPTPYVPDPLFDSGLDLTLTTGEKLETGDSCNEDTFTQAQKPFFTSQSTSKSPIKEGVSFTPSSGDKEKGSSGKSSTKDQPNERTENIYDINKILLNNSSNEAFPAIIPHYDPPNSILNNVSVGYDPKKNSVSINYNVGNAPDASPSQKFLKEQIQSDLDNPYSLKTPQGLAAAQAHYDQEIYRQAKNAGIEKICRVPNPKLNGLGHGPCLKCEELSDGTRVFFWEHTQKAGGKVVYEFAACTNKDFLRFFDTKQTFSTSHGLLTTTPSEYIRNQCMQNKVRPTLNLAFEKMQQQQRVISSSKFLLSRDFACAEPLLEQAYAKDPTSIPVLKNLVYLCSETNNPMEKKYVEELFTLCPSDPQARSGMAKILAKEGSLKVQEGDLIGGVNKYKDSLAIQDDPKIREEMANHCLQAESADLKKEGLDLLQDIHTSSAHIKKASIAFKDHDFSLANQELGEALKIEPDNCALLLKKAVLEEILGDKNAAIENYEKVLKTHPTNSSINTQLGLLYAEKKDHKKAIEYFDQVSSLESNPEAFLISGFEKLTTNDRLDEAKEIFIKASIALPLSGLPQLGEAAVYLKKGDSFTASSIFLEIQGKNLFIPEKFGELYSTVQRASEVTNAFSAFFTLQGIITQQQVSQTNAMITMSHSPAFVSVKTAQSYLLAQRMLDALNQKEDERPTQEGGHCFSLEELAHIPEEVRYRV